MEEYITCSYFWNDSNNNVANNNANNNVDDDI